MSIDSAPFGSNKLFLGTDEEILAELAAIPRRVDSAAGTLIFQEGDDADCFYLIAGGCVRVSKRGRGGKQETLSHFRRDDFFGEMAIFDPAPRSAQATTTEATLLGRVDDAGFRRMLEIAPLEISSNLTRETIRRLRRMDSLLIEELLEAERLSLVGSMASTIIHDFKNPINVVMGAVQMLERRNDDPRLSKYAGMIRRSVDRMLSMAQELLDFSRGVTSLELTAVSIPDLLEELDEQALHLLPAARIEVERTVGFNGTLVMDRNRFIRLLLNLVRNAVEAMPGGGVLRIGVERADGAVLFTVEDTGGGIPENILPTIFEPFVTHGKQGGTGLGMAIAKSVVDAHGGTISIASTPGTGTRVSVVIPEDPARAPAI
jgi:signal transduction histidine kinase